MHFYLGLQERHQDNSLQNSREKVTRPKENRLEVTSSSRKLKKTQLEVTLKKTREKSAQSHFELQKT